MDQITGILVSLAIGVALVLWLVGRPVYSRFERGVLWVVFALMVVGAIKLLITHAL
jgi:hypothetical protein